MLKKTAILILLLPLAVAATLQTSQVNVQEGSITDIGVEEVLTDFGMITGVINFKLGNYSWPPEEIWLISEKIDPDIFSKGLKQNGTLEIPENLTFSTCRTAVYINTTSNITGFKIYNTATKKQILENGTFCGLAYQGSYYVFVSY
jgi:hypothetical protein